MLVLVLLRRSRRREFWRRGSRTVQAVEACHGGGWFCYGQVCSGGRGVIWFAAATLGQSVKVGPVMVSCVQAG